MSRRGLGTPALMDDAHGLEMSLRREHGRLTGLCRCGVELEADSVEQLRQQLAEHGLREVPEPRSRHDT